MNTNKRTRIQASSFGPYRKAGFTLIPLHRPNATRVLRDKKTGKSKTKRIGKQPLDFNWTTRQYDAAAVIKQCAKDGLNAGVRLRATDLVIDVDPRNGGNKGLADLQLDLGLDLSTFPRVVTGSGGFHIYGRKPAGLAVVDTLPAYPGVEFKSKGRQVVAAGSVHPDTSKLYNFDPDYPDLDDAPEWPKELLKTIKRPKPVNEIKGGGQYTQEQIARALAKLDPEEFRDHDEWLRLMMAVHHASNGDARDEFVEWSTSDPNYAGDAEIIGRRWDSLHAERHDGVTYQTLNWILSEHGAADATVPGDAASDFDGEPADIPEDDAEPERKKLIFSPFVLRDPAEIPPREFIYRPIYIRKFLSVTTALGGVGKSRLAMTEAVAMASGKALLGIEPVRRLRVVYWNGEDPEDEIDRGLHAICKYYELNSKDVENYLFRDSGRVMPIKIARTKSGMTQIALPVVKELQQALKDMDIDCMIVDPFVASHAATENDSNAMEAVAKKWSHIADQGNLSIGVVHHNRKPTNGAVGTIDDARGSTALINAARVRRAINKMTEAQAKGAGLDPAKRQFYISADLGNTNVMKPATALTWYELESVDLENMTPDQDSDEIGVPVLFDYVAIEEVETTPEEGDAVLAVLRQRDNWRADTRSKEWVGHAIGEQLGLITVGDSHAKERKRVRKIIADWLADGTLVEYQGKDENRHDRAFIKVVRQSPVPASVTDAD